MEVRSNGTTTTTTDYYQAGPITAVSVNGTLSYLVPNTLGSISAALDGSGHLEAASLYTPYGSVLYSTGTMPTAKGFIGQYGDSVTGLDYFSARYYDPAVGQFTQADLVQGPNRYAYAGDNPATLTDPTGKGPCALAAGGMQAAGMGCMPGGSNGIFAAPTSAGGCPSVQCDVSALITAASFTVAPFYSWARGTQEAGGPPAVSDALYLMSDLTGEGDLGPLLYGAASATSPNISDQQRRDAIARSLRDLGLGPLADLIAQASDGSCANSFAADTPVATPQGSTTIATLKEGETVTAYDPKTGTTKAERVDHVFIHHDVNLMDVTLRPEHKPTAKQGHHQPANETLHTTTEHPFLTTDRGFVDAILLHIGERVQAGDGTTGIVVALRVVAGTAVRYNLTVHELHTYLVGDDQWVVHNCTPQARTANQIAQNLKSALISTIGDDAFAGTTISVGVLANGTWYASLNSGGATNYKAFAAIVNAQGGTLIGPTDQDYNQGRYFGRHAEKFIIDYVNQNRLPLRGIASTTVICPDCYRYITDGNYNGVASWPVSIIGSPYRTVAGGPVIYP